MFCFSMTSTDTMSGCKRLWRLGAGEVRLLPTTRFALPRPKRAGIQVHKIRPAVIADAAALQILRMRGKARAIHSGHPHVDGPPFPMQAVLGDARALLAQTCVRLRGPVAGNHTEYRIDARGVRDFDQVTHQPGIDVMSLAGAKIPQ